MADLVALRSRALDSLASCSDAAALDAWRIDFLGRQGAVTMVLRGLGELPVEERRTLGAEANALRTELEAALEVRRAEVERNAIEQLEAGSIDV
ncbi:MAG TPA: phenylalanine--tRNA ligase subunit alpha, partial [Dehalococcoidia bacterium]|nr:phenylalanine--tRNA ligase subunit alpha [Dehalococcoidia bacterium]